MRTSLLCLFACCMPFAGVAQANVDAQEVVNRSIRYHDPSGRWNSFARTLLFRETRPGQEDRSVSVTLDKPNQRFVYERTDDGRQIIATLDREDCGASVDGSPTFSPADAERYGLGCEQIKRRRNYYLYLWGLPMKLRDEGTIIAPEVSRGTFENREVLQIDVSYDPAIGTDSWHFYFDPVTYGLVGYRFNHDEALNDGEYIVLDGEYTLDDMRIPRRRSWYFNKDGKYLGTDILEGHRRVSYQWQTHR